MDKKPPVQMFDMFRKSGMQRGPVLGIILVVALFAFEVFNYSTTDFALTDLLGANLTFAGVRWATILSIAFCGIDFAGIARLFTPEQGRDEPAEVWYLFGAWILAAAMNATLTWWGVAVAVNSHTPLGSAILGRETLMKIVPVFVAVMVWIIRILIIGSFSMAGERFFWAAAPRYSNRPTETGTRPFRTNTAPRPAATVNRPQSAPPQQTVYPEPTYHPVGSLAAKPRDKENNARRY
jgi:hypothetical protein